MAYSFGNEPECKYYTQITCSRMYIVGISQVFFMNLEKNYDFVELSSF